MEDDVVIVGAARTPIGNFQGSLASISATQLGSVAIAAAVERSGVNASDLDSVMMGCVLPAGLGQAPARQAAIGAGVPSSVGCSTINKMCGSGMKTVMLAHDSIKAGTSDIVLAGGMESMTNAPYLLPNARAGYRLGHQRVLDHMFYDGLEDAFDSGKLMGNFAELCAEKYHFTRQDQDAFAIESLTRAQAAQKNGDFADEIVSVTTQKGDTITEDDGPIGVNIEKIPLLKPAFAQDGTVTAANSSKISDGAAAVVLMRSTAAAERELIPLARIVGHSTQAQDSTWFTTAPIGAIEKLLQKTGWSVDEVDLFEINEAFAVVAMAAMRDLNIAHEKLNIHGGACALGHPVGATGTRIIVTLLHALQRKNLRKGIAALCIGGGEATAIALELI